MKRGLVRWDWATWSSFRLSKPWLAAAALLVGCETLWFWFGAGIYVGRIPVDPGLVPGLILAVWLGSSVLCANHRSFRAWAELFAAGSVMLSVLVVAFVHYVGSPLQVVAVIAAAATEELVFRLACPLVAGAVCAALLGQPWRNPRDWSTVSRVVAIAVAAVSFSLQPGHLAQATTPTVALQFPLLAICLTYVMLRVGSVVGGMMVHAVWNLMFYIVIWGGVMAVWRPTIVIVASAGFFCAYNLAAKRLGLLQGSPEVGPALTQVPSSLEPVPVFVR